MERYRIDGRSYWAVIRKAWEPFVGPHGGRGWKSSVTGEVRYQEDQPGEREETGAVVGISPMHPKIFDSPDEASRFIDLERERGIQIRVTRTPSGKYEVRRASRYAAVERQPEEWALGKVTYEGDEERSVWLRKEVAAWLMLIPEEHRDAVNRIEIRDAERLEETYLGRDTNLAGVAYIDGSIALYPGEFRFGGSMSSGKYEYAVEVVLHETGHQVAKKLFGTFDPYEAAGYSGGKVHDIMRDTPVSIQEELKESAREQLKTWKGELYKRLKLSADVRRLRPEDRRGKRMTKDELRISEEAYRDEFRKELGFEPEDAFTSEELRKKISATGRPAAYFWIIYEIEFFRRRARGEEPLAPRPGYIASGTMNPKLAASYVDTARKDGRWPSGYAEDTGTSEEKGQRWKRIGRHGAPGLSEDFAESYSGWLLRSENFMSNCPNRHRWMVEQFGEPPRHI